MSYEGRDKIVVVKRRTRLEDLISRFGTRDQAKFYVEHSGLSFADYQEEHDNYAKALAALNASLATLPHKVQVVDREFLPNFIFGGDDIVVVIGQDGLVVNTAKYLNAQQIVAVNPDPRRFDGVLLPFSPRETAGVIQDMDRGKVKCRSVSMAEARLNNGQALLAFNELFIGAKSHVSARYGITYHGQTERQSSSGVIVSTGAGSTGWLSSTFNMARGVMKLFNPEPQSGSPTPPRLKPLSLPWEDKRLIFVVREPFESVSSTTAISAGLVESGQSLILESHMPENGVIFSDGVENDFLEFNSGVVATICVAKRCARLVTRE